MEQALSWLQFHLFAKNMPTSLSLPADAIKPPKTISLLTASHFFVFSIPSKFSLQALCPESFLLAAVFRAYFSFCFSYLVFLYMHTHKYTLTQSKNHQYHLPTLFKIQGVLLPCLRNLYYLIKELLGSVISDEGWWLLPSASMPLLPVLNNSTSCSPCLCPYRIFYLLIFHLSLYCLIWH